MPIFGRNILQEIWNKHECTGSHISFHMFVLYRVKLKKLQDSGSTTRRSITHTAKTHKKPTFNLWPWKSLGFVRLSRHMFLQKFIELQRFMSYRANREEKNSDENNTVHRYCVHVDHNKLPTSCLALDRASNWVWSSCSSCSMPLRVLIAAAVASSASSSYRPHQWTDRNY